jgi:hypothetical protein
MHIYQNKTDFCQSFSKIRLQNSTKDVHCLPYAFVARGQPAVEYRHAGLTVSQHGQLKPPTRPGQSASGGLCDQLKSVISTTMIFVRSGYFILCRLDSLKFTMVNCQL